MTKNWAPVLFTHPLEFWSILRFYIFYKLRSASIKQEPASGWHRSTMRRAWQLMELTSRSFSAMIITLDADVAQVICILYLVLRALDTVEDDVSIPDEKKHPILKGFHTHSITPGWTFDAEGKGRQILLEYNNIVDEINLLSPDYKTIILDACHRMGNGMVDLVHAPTTGPAVIAFDTIDEYERYCLCVSGLVYEALARIFSASGREDTWTDSQMNLLISLAVMLQKVDIICDFYEDVGRGHHFWPREIWGRSEYGSFANQSDLVKAAEQGQDGALYALSEMIVNSLEHSIEALESLVFVKTERVLHFYAIHLTKGVATLEMCFMNRDVFTKHLNMPKGDLAQLLMRSASLEDISRVFHDNAKKILPRASPADPNFSRITAACQKIMKWHEDRFPPISRPVPQKSRDFMNTYLFIIFAIFISSCTYGHHVFG